METQNELFLSFGTAAARFIDRGVAGFGDCILQHAIFRALRRATFAKE